MKIFTWLPATLTIFALAGLTPIAALAAGCGDYPLTQAELQLIDDLPVAIPEGDVPVIQRCDTNSDGAVDIYDIRAISLQRNQPAAHPDDPMDLDQNGVINVLDARGCVLACNLPRCAVSRARLSEPQTTAGVTQDAQCFQRTDLDGDGSEDIAAIFEYTGTRPRGGDWTLQVVILYKDDNGNLQNITYPYSGQRSTENGGQLRQHLSLQPAGVVDLAPGNLTIDQPAVVSFRDGVPAVIYYFQDGKINRAFYGVDD
ncbi:MAG: hypothetical protein OER87_13650 [Gammaproteobacteria bacterium]|nr:hypothetical protein [Gammaproteobacteria bacterium]MDH3536783.1 hypothetical protein [Gammaproteobacteria bacterium]